MKITPYHIDSRLTAGLVDLVDYCQNKEAHLGIKMIEQPDMFEIPAYYQQPGGNFWLATDNGQVVGSIGLLRLSNQVGVLKKLFTYPKYRGQPQRLGQQLLMTLLAFARDTGLQTLYLDTPAGEVRSHYFYEKHGFIQINRADLTVHYVFPDRDSLIYRCDLTESETKGG